jgi:light-harvesting complex I chlorophyll a/b binding protein 1
MKVTALFLALLPIASAFLAPQTNFASTPSVSRKNAMKMDATEMNGIDTETRGQIFDPAGLSRGKDDETLAWYRAAELKHGRVCMLATAGIFHQQLGFTFPDPVFQETNPFDAITKVFNERPLAAIQILIAIAAVEVLGASIQKYSEPGDLKFDPLGIKPEDEEEFAKIQLKEIKNGRLAMISFAGMVAQEAVTGQGVVDQLKSFF